MRIVPITADDLWLTERFEGDAEMMKHIGPPRSKEEIAEVHQRRLDMMARGEAFMFKVLPDDSDEPMGSIGFWASEWNGAPIHEMGWMTLPEFQGQGVATEAGLLLLERARAEGVTDMHAFPNVTNAASNVIAQKLGFENMGEFAFDFNGQPLRSNDWRLVLG